MSRLERRFRTEKELGIMSKGGALDLFDNVIKTVFRIDDNQFNYMCDVMSESEISLFTSENLSFSGKRDLLKMVEGHLLNYNKNNVY